MCESRYADADTSPPRSPMSQDGCPSPVWVSPAELSLAALIAASSHAKLLRDLIAGHPTATADDIARECIIPYLSEKIRTTASRHPELCDGVLKNLSVEAFADIAIHAASLWKARTIDAVPPGHPILNLALKSPELLVRAMKNTRDLIAVAENNHVNVFDARSSHQARHCGDPVLNLRHDKVITRSNTDGSPGRSPPPVMKAYRLSAFQNSFRGDTATPITYVRDPDALLTLALRGARALGSDICSASLVPTIPCMIGMAIAEVIHPVQPIVRDGECAGAAVSPTFAVFCMERTGTLFRSGELCHDSNTTLTVYMDYGNNQMAKLTVFAHITATQTVLVVKEGMFVLSLFAAEFQHGRAGKRRSAIDGESLYWMRLFVATSMRIAALGKRLRDEAGLSAPIGAFKRSRVDDEDNRQ